MKKVLVFGTFDGIHEGHLDFFKQAKECGDYLVVVVGRDATVEEIKNRRPNHTEKERVEDLRKLELINEVLLGNAGDPYKIIEEVKPDVICLGYDQDAFVEGLQDAINKLNLKIRVVRLRAFEPDTYHSSKLSK